MNKDLEGHLSKLGGNKDAQGGDKERGPITGSSPAVKRNSLRKGRAIA